MAVSPTTGRRVEPPTFENLPTVALPVKLSPVKPSPVKLSQRRKVRPIPWWLPLAACGLTAAMLFLTTVLATETPARSQHRCPRWLNSRLPLLAGPTTGFDDARARQQKERRERALTSAHLAVSQLRGTGAFNASTTTANITLRAGILEHMHRALQDGQCVATDAADHAMFGVALAALSKIRSFSTRGAGGLHGLGRLQNSTRGMGGAHDRGRHALSLLTNHNRTAQLSAHLRGAGLVSRTLTTGRLRGSARSNEDR